MKKIDSHVHFWDPEKLEYPWLSSVPILEKAFLPPQYLHETNDDDLLGCVFVQCDAIPSQSLEEVQMVESLAVDYSFIKGIVASVPLENGLDVKPYLEHLKEHSLVKGVRRLLQGESAEFSLQKGFLEGLRLLQEYQLPFDICIKGVDQMDSILSFTKQLSDQKFILDHCGKPMIGGDISTWQMQIKKLGERKNVCCKLSGLLTEMDKAEDDLELHRCMEIILESFGVDRILFGSDWPVCTLKGGYQKWATIVDTFLESLSENEQSKIYSKNAIEFYQL